VSENTPSVVAVNRPGQTRAPDSGNRQAPLPSPWIQMVTALQELENMLRHEREVKAVLLAALKALHAKPTPGTLEQALAAIAKAES
jgi:hypothetical protein